MTNDHLFWTNNGLFYFCNSCPMGVPCFTCDWRFVLDCVDLCIRWGALKMLCIIIIFFSRDVITLGSGAGLHRHLHLLPGGLRSTACLLQAQRLSLLPHPLSVHRHCHKIRTHRRHVWGNLFFNYTFSVTRSNVGLVTGHDSLSRTDLQGTLELGDAVVGRGNAGWTTSRSGRPCTCRNCSRWWPSTERTGRGSLLKSSLCPPGRSSRWRD